MKQSKNNIASANMPLSMRKHVALFGNTNAGKSTLFNQLLGQDMSIVSQQHGTTTDPVIKAMELNRFGPIALIDTAGLNDLSVLGKQRTEKTAALMQRTDLAVYLMDAGEIARDTERYAARDTERYSARDTERYTTRDSEGVRNAYEQFVLDLQKYQTPHILIFSKSDTVSVDERERLQRAYPEAVFVSFDDAQTVHLLKERLVDELSRLSPGNDTILGNLLPQGSTVLLVTPIDSAAPKGRMILPQIQVLRDCLDHGMKCMFTREHELLQALSELKNIDLVVADSQVFAYVNERIPREMRLTSFSMLLANQNGDMKTYMEGVHALEVIPEGAKILMAEACTHSHTHEDIGRVKIPKWVQEYAEKEFGFEYTVSHQFPEDLTGYAMVIHCGGCMVNKKTMASRILMCKAQGIPITNYGVVIAYVNGILERCGEIF